MSAIPLAGCRYVSYGGPLSPSLAGAAVFRNDQVLGVAWDVDVAAAKQRAIGEAVERIALECDHRQFGVDTAVRLGERALSLKGAVRFSTRQLASDALARYRWTDETPTSWTVATRLERPDAQVLVPADLVYFRRTNADATLIRPASSTGTAAHPLRDDALLHALLECIERHEIAVAHRHGSVPTRVHVDQHPQLRAIAGPLTTEDIRLDVGLLPVSFGIPVAVAAIITSRTGRPSIAVGSSASPDVVCAMVAAALEAIQIFHLAWQLLHRGNEAPQLPRTSHERALWWATRPSEYGARLFRDAPPVRLQSGGVDVSKPTSAETVQRVVTRLVQKGHRGAMLDITPAGSQSDAPHVMRVILPSLLLPHKDERYPFENALCDPGSPVETMPHPYA